MGSFVQLHTPDGQAFARIGGDAFDAVAAERADLATLDFLENTLRPDNVR